MHCHECRLEIMMAKTFEQLVRAPAGRFDGISRPYTPAAVEKLRGSVPIAYTLAERGANRLWQSLKTEPFVNSLGDVTGNQAMQQARAGLPAIYLSGWQVAADANTAGAMYPDQSEHSEGGAKIDWFVPVVADAEAGFGGPLNSFEIMKAYIEAGAAGVHFEDQLASEKKCGHMGGKVLIPAAAHGRNLIAARLAADVCGTPTVVLARTDAESAKLITADVDERDREFITGERTAEGFFRLKSGTGLAHCIKRGIAFAKYADLLWWETSTPNLEEAKEFADAVHKVYPNKMLAYNCSPSFNWEANIDKATIAKFQREIGAMGYKFQFVTLAGFHSLNHGMFELARGYKAEGMAAYSRLQQAEFASEKHGYSATRHQREVGTGYFDLVSTTITGGTSSTTALHDSTEAAQFKKHGDEIKVQAAE